MNLSNRHSLTTMLIITSEQNTQQDAIADLFIFLLQYSFLFNEPSSGEEILKRDFPYPGKLSSQNPNGARYFDARYKNELDIYNQYKLKQMARIMKNSGYGETEAVKWIEDNIE